MQTMRDDAPSPARRGVWIKLVLSAALAIAFWFALAPYLDAVPEDLDLPASAVVAYLASLLPYHFLRAGRWRVLLKPLAPQQVPGRWEVTRIGLAGYMWIALLPFRLGEFARPVFLAQRSPIAVPQALGTVAIERAVDGVMVCGLFFVGMAGASAHGETQALYFASYVVMGLFSAALLGMLAAARWPDAIAGLAARCVRWASTSLADRVTSIVHGVAQGFSALPDVRAIFSFVFVSLGYWLANAAGVWLLADACGLGLSFFEAIATLAVMNLALLIPGGPAQLGVFQTGIAVALHLFLPSELVRDDGSKFAFYLYVCQLGTIVALGLGSQASLRLDWRGAIGASREPDR